MELRNIIDPEISRIVKDLIDASSKIAITCHVSPDGDAMGSSLGLAHVLKAIGKEVKVITPDTPPQVLSFMPGYDGIIVASREYNQAKKILDTSDLIFCLDYNGLKRIDRMGDALKNAGGKKVMVDHHPFPEDFADIVISKPEISSTCELVYRFLKSMGLDTSVNKEAAECIYTGMLTDTGNFSYNSNDRDIYLIIAELIDKGLDKDSVYEKAWNTNSEGRLRICGYSLYKKMELDMDRKLSIIALSKEELEEFGYVKGDTEGLVNKPLSIPGIEWSVFLRADEKDFVKISMRSKGEFAVNGICEKLYGGGGHKNAAGGELNGTLEEGIKILKEYLDKQ